MTINEIREKYFNFFKDKGHSVIPSASLVPLNDPTTLFTGSGMQPMVSYLLGEPHPLGTRIVDSQKSFRGVDIEEVGDNRHTTFFEMLGNWSLGDYFKKEQIHWIFDFLVKEVGLDIDKIYITTFIGDKENNLPKDTEAGAIWKELFEENGVDAKEVEIGGEEDGYKKGMQGGKIFYYDSKKNWWSRSGGPDTMPAGEPGGGDSEIFYEFESIEHDSSYGKYCHPNCDCGRFLEIGNNVFMEYKKNKDGTFSSLPKQNVDFGGGLERVAAAKLGTPDVFKIDVFNPVIKILEKLSGKKYDNPEYTASFRVIADHTRAAIFLIGDGVSPSNNQQGYFVRRLIRRAVRHFDKLGIKESDLSSLVDPLIHVYKDAYAETYQQKEAIKSEIKKEEDKFKETLKKGLKEFEKGTDPFVLFTTYGFPIELTEELAQEKGMFIDTERFNEQMKKHKELSQTASAGMFKGGLADDEEETVKLHTAHHLLLAGLQKIVDSNIKQRGSNITKDRLRMDFSFDRKLTDEEKQKVEDWVNEKINEGIDMSRIELSKEEAENSGAQMEFGAKYPDTVSVYYIGGDLKNAISKEFCGGPHVKNTKELGEEGKRFKIKKEKASSRGVRRIKAVLQ